MHLLRFLRLYVSLWRHCGQQFYHRRRSDAEGEPKQQTLQGIRCCRPSISTQFGYAKLGQVVSGLKALGFYNVVEAALGADMVSLSESRELAQRGFLTSSCCPAFVDYIKKNFPALTDKISSNLSPMGAVGKFIKSTDPKSKVVFIGPCTAKKMEFQLPEVRPFIDSVLTFEELYAMLKPVKSI